MYALYGAGIFHSVFFMSLSYVINSTQTPAITCCKGFIFLSEFFCCTATDLIFNPALATAPPHPSHSMVWRRQNKKSHTFIISTAPESCFLITMLTPYQCGIPDEPADALCISLQMKLQMLMWLCQCDC